MNTKLEKKNLEDAMDRHLHPMLRLADQLTSTTEMAEKMVTRSFLDVYGELKNKDHGSGDEDIKMRLYRRLIEKIDVDKHISESRAERAPRPAYFTAAFGQAPQPAKRLRALMAQVTGEELCRVIADLPPRLRLMTMLYYVGGFTQHQVAELTGASPARVRNDLRKSRLRLHEHIWNKEHPEQELNRPMTQAAGENRDEVPLRELAGVGSVTSDY